MVSRWAHNSKVGGSKPLSAIFFSWPYFAILTIYQSSSVPKQDCPSLLKSLARYLFVCKLSFKIVLLNKRAQSSQKDLYQNLFDSYTDKRLMIQLYLLFKSTLIACIRFQLSSMSKPPH